MPGPLIALAPIAARLVGGAVARKAGSGLLGRAVAGQAASGATQFGLGALTGGGQQKQDHGVTQWARQNPGEAAVGVVGAALARNPLSDQAGSAYQGVIQSAQFGR